MPLLTVGHGTATEQGLGDLLLAADVDLVVDVRRFPGSRRHPQFGREELERWLPGRSVTYRWEPRLGGRRRPTPGSPHQGLRNVSFRAYADHMQSPEFREAIDGLLIEAEECTVAVMCSESLWWRCHRRLIADHLTGVEQRPVVHLMHDGTTTPHRPTDVAQVVDGEMRYDQP